MQKVDLFDMDQAETAHASFSLIVSWMTKDVCLCFQVCLHVCMYVFVYGVYG